MQRLKVNTAAVLVIGDEILSGRTLDKNTQTIALAMTAIGVHLIEARIVPDDIDQIVSHLNELRAKADVVFTTGGIGPTHDDKTSEAIAKTFGEDLILHPDAYQNLIDHYGGEENINEGRRKMAMMPSKATLINNPISGAPGFVVENVYVMAGVPAIMTAMLENVMDWLQGGPVLLSRTVMSEMMESELAPVLADMQEKYEDISVGSYPQYNNGFSGVSIVLRGVDEERLDEAENTLEELLASLQ